MKKLLENKYFRVLAQAAFFVWGMTIMSLYFFYYPHYGGMFLFNIMLALHIGLFIAILFYIVVQTNTLLKACNCRSLSKEKTINFFKKKFSAKEIKVPLLLFPLYLYGCALLWILYIMIRSKNITIVANDFAAIFFTTLLVVIAFSLGYKILKFFRYEFQGYLEKFVLSEAIGFGALMLIMYILGMIGLYYRSVAYLLVATIILLTRKEIKELWSYVNTKTLLWHPQPIFSFKNFLLLSIFAVVGIYVAGMFQQYPTGYDGLHTYVAFPKAYIENHQIVHFKYWIFSGFPQNGEMIFTLGFLLKDFLLVPCILFVIILLTALSLFLFSISLFKSSQIAILSSFFFLLLPITSSFNIVDTKVDPLLVFYFILAIFYLIQYTSSKETDNNKIILASILIGIMSGIKYNFFSLLLPCVILLILLSTKLSITRKIKSIILCLSIIALFFSPWALKNYYYTGNPIDPIAGDILSREDVFLKSIQQTYLQNIKAIFDDAQIGYENQELKNWKFFVFFPFRIAFNIKSRNDYDMVNVGPFILFFLPLSLLYTWNKKNSIIKNLLLLSLAGILLWIIFTNFITWYLYPIIALFSIILAYTTNKALSSIFKYITISVIIVFSSAFIVKQTQTRIITRSLFLNEGNTNFDLILMSKYINEELPKDEKIWGMLYPYNYYIGTSHDRLIYDFYGATFKNFASQKKPNEIKKELANLGIKYFLYKGYPGDEYNSYMLNKATKNYKTSPVTANNFIQNYFTFFKYRNASLSLRANIGSFYLYEIK